MKRLATSISLTATGHGMAMLAIIAGQVVLARTETLAVFGAFAAAQALVAVAETAIISRGGEAATQYLGHYWTGGDERLKAIARRLLGLDIVYCLVGYAAFVVFALLAAHVFKINGAYVIGLALAIPVQIGFGIRRSLFVVAGDMRGQAFFEIISATVLLVLSVGLTAAFGVWGMIVASVGAAAFKNAFVHWRTRGYWRGPAAAATVGLDKDVIAGMRTASGHAMARNLLSSATTNADILILGATGRPEMVAVYRIARTLAGIPTRLAAPIWTVFRPNLLVALRENDHRAYCTIVFKVAAVFAGLMVAAVPVLFLLGPFLIERFYGADFSGAFLPLVILFLGNSVFGAVTGWLSFTLIISSRKTLGTTIFAVQLMLTVLFGWLVGSQSATHMAGAILGCNILLSAVAWGALLTGRFRAADAPPA